MIYKHAIDFILGEIILLVIIGTYVAKYPIIICCDQVHGGNYVPNKLGADWGNISSYIPYCWARDSGTEYSERKRRGGDDPHPRRGICYGKQGVV